MSTSSLNRRTLLRGAGVAGAAGLAVAGTASTASASPVNDGCSPAFGTWQVTVHDAAGNLLDQGVQAAFHQDGLITGANGHGRTIIGSWQPTGATTFTFFAHEQLFDSTGAITGIAHLSHNATVSGDTFTSVGTVTGYTLTGQVIFQQPANITAARFRMS